MPRSTHIQVTELDLVSPTEAARLLGKPRPTVYRLIREGKLPAYRLPGGKRLWLLRQDIRRILGKG